jgi:hypothetical protein
MQERRSLFNRMWEEEQQRITTEQAIFKEQVGKLIVHEEAACSE